jgi:hypothetical protein
VDEMDSLYEMGKKKKEAAFEAQKEIMKMVATEKSK